VIFFVFYFLFTFAVFSLSRATNELLIPSLCPPFLLFSLSAARLSFILFAVAFAFNLLIALSFFLFFQISYQRKAIVSVFCDLGNVRLFFVAVNGNATMAVIDCGCLLIE